MKYFLIALAIAMVFLAARSIERTTYGTNEPTSAWTSSETDPATRCEGAEGSQEQELSPTTSVRGEAACCAPRLGALPLTAQAR